MKARMLDASGVYNYVRRERDYMLIKSQKLLQEIVNTSQNEDSEIINRT